MALEETSAIIILCPYEVRLYSGPSDFFVFNLPHLSSFPVIFPLASLCKISLMNVLWELLTSCIYSMAGYSNTRKKWNAFPTVFHKLQYSTSHVQKRILCFQRQGNILHHLIGNHTTNLHAELFYKFSCAWSLW